MHLYSAYDGYCVGEYRCVLEHDMMVLSLTDIKYSHAQLLVFRIVCSEQNNASGYYAHAASLPSQVLAPQVQPPQVWHGPRQRTVGQSGQRRLCLYPRHHLQSSHHDHCRQSSQHNHGRGHPLLISRPR